MHAKLERVIALGKQDGIKFRFASSPEEKARAAQMDPKLRPNTVAAHRLLRFAFQMGGSETQAALLDVLFSAYFENGEDIADSRTLSELAAPILAKDPESLVMFIESELLKSEVLEDEEHGRKLGVSGVPSFLFDFRYNDTKIFDFSLLGTQEIRTMQQIVDRGFQVFSKRLRETLRDGVADSLSDLFLVGGGNETANL